MNTLLTNYKSKLAFTLTETLVALLIVGVIAATTLPGVIANHQKKVTAQKLKVAYSTLLNAIELSKVENGDIKNWNIYVGSTWKDYNINKTFVEEYILPYVKYTNTCIKQDRKCHGSTYKTLAGTSGASYFNSYTSDNTYYGFILPNGISYSFWVYGKSQINGNPPYVYVLVDINGRQKPNILGKDLFKLIIKSDGVHSELCGNSIGEGLYFQGSGCGKNFLKSNSTYGCKKTGSGIFIGSYCGALIIENNWKIPDDYPWK